jgi:hypothetical protein
MSFSNEFIKHNFSDDEKGVINREAGTVEPYTGDVEDPLEQNEVFKKTHDGVDFRTVGWMRASVIFLKSKIPNSLKEHVLIEF